MNDGLDEDRTDLIQPGLSIASMVSRIVLMVMFMLLLSARGGRDHQARADRLKVPIGEAAGWVRCVWKAGDVAEKQYLELDGLRGVAAISVGLLHEQAFFGGTKFFAHGYLAVDFFYMLSGFVLAHAYGERLQRTGSFLPFIKDRAIRLYPMIVLGALVGLCESMEYLSSFSAGRAATTVANSLGLPAIWSADPFWINPPTWSLFFEIIANILFAWTAISFSPPRSYLWLLSLIIGMVILDVHYGSFDFGWLRSALVPGLDRVFVGFISGVFLYRLHLRGIFATGGKSWWVPAALTTSFIVSIPGSIGSTIYDPLIVFGLYPLVILAGAGGKVLVPRLAIYSGAISYPFYVLHPPLIRILQNDATRMGWPLNAFSVATILLITVGISWAVLRLYDEPIRRHLRKRFGSEAHRSNPLTPPLA